MFRSMVLALSFFAGGALVHAESRTIKAVDEATFDNLKPEMMDAKTLYYFHTPDPSTFEVWSRKAEEKEFLTLFDGYTEPSFAKVKGGRPELEKLTMFVSKSKTIVNKPASQIDLKKMITLGYVSKLDPEIKHVQVRPDQLMPVIAGKKPIENFNQCNVGFNPVRGPYFTRPQKEVDLDVLNPKDRGGQGWCNTPERSICVESCYIFSTGWQAGVLGVNKFQNKSESQHKDYGLAIQSEIRYFVNEAEMNKRLPVKALTRINTPVRGVLEQNMFYFNQVIQYGKVVAFFQEHPTDAGKTVVTSYVVIGLRSRSYNQHAIMKDVLMGRASALNTASGVSAGLPVFTQNLTKSIADGLDN